MHVLDFIEGRGGDFVTMLNRMIEPTGARVLPASFRMPISRAQPKEAIPFQLCPKLLASEISLAGRRWWLGDTNPAGGTPNIDLAVTAKFSDGSDGLILTEAKAHVGELDFERRGKLLPIKCNPLSKRRHERIADAIQEAADWLGGEKVGVRISRDSHYQFANRLAMSCFLAKHNIPIVLMYLGFTCDAGIRSSFRNPAHWQDQVLEHTREIYPASWWNSRLPWNGGTVWTIIRSLPCVRQTPNADIPR